MSALLFYILAIGSVSCALLMILSKKAVNSAVALVGVMLCLAGLFAMQNAHLIAALQVLVYAGAIMVLVLFVIMLLNLREKGGLLTGRQPFIQVGAVVLLNGLLAPLVSDYVMAPTTGIALTDPATFGTVKGVGTMLFTEYLLPFEIASILLLAALVGAVVLTKNKKNSEG